MTKDDYNYRQGRSTKQVQNSEKLAYISTIAFIIMTVVMISVNIINS